MTFVNIYHTNKKVSVEQPKRDFYIIASDEPNRLYWESDPQPKSRPGVIKIWVQHIDTNPCILYVLPDWRLTIDGQTSDQGLYEQIKNLNEKVVELESGDYRFVFQFR